MKLNDYLTTQSYDMYWLSIEITNKMKDNEIIEELKKLCNKKDYFILEKNENNVLILNNKNRSFLSIIKNLFLGRNKNLLSLRIYFSKNSKNGIKILEIYRVQGENEKLLDFIKFLKTNFNKKMNEKINGNGKQKIINDSKIIQNQKISLKENLSELTEFSSSYIYISKLLNNYNYGIGKNFKNFLNKINEIDIKNINSLNLVK